MQPSSILGGNAIHMPVVLKARTVAPATSFVPKPAGRTAKHLCESTKLAPRQPRQSDPIPIGRESSVALFFKTVWRKSSICGRYSGLDSGEQRIHLCRIATCDAALAEKSGQYARPEPYIEST
jgi:hypothetical protein